MYFITKIYYSFDEYELAKKYASILAYNFPKSKWYKKSYNLINNLEDVGENQNWYEKLNPIRIFKLDVEKNSDNKIQYIE